MLIRASLLSSVTVTVFFISAPYFVTKRITAHHDVLHFLFDILYCLRYIPRYMTITELSALISECLRAVQRGNGWSIDDLSGYCEVNYTTMRNALARATYSDLLVTILKLKKLIPDDLAFEYRKALNRSRMERRKS